MTTLPIAVAPLTSHVGGSGLGSNARISQSESKTMIRPLIDATPQAAQPYPVVICMLSTALRLCAIASSAIGLLGCAEHAQNVLIPLDVDVPHASIVDMLVMTTRAPSSTNGQLFSGERGDSRSLNEIVVSLPPDASRTIGEVQWPNSHPADPARDFVTLKVADMTREQADPWFRRVVANGHKLLIFVHGFNTTYEEAVYRFAQVVHDAGTRAAPILFTWPSRGDLLQYAYDKESATGSRDALEALLARASVDPNVSDITVLAHSMGNWVAMEALRQMAIRRGHISPKIRNVILASADLDVDVFKSEFVAIPSPRPRFTLLVSSDDRALRFSKVIGGDIDRLGEIDPSVEPYRSKLAAADITAIDLTRVRSGDEINHSKFAESPEIVRLIGTRLIEGQKIESADLSVGSKVGQMMSQAAVGVGSTVDNLGAAR